MLDDPYYNYAPTVVFSRPVALVGFMGARVPLTGAILSAKTGLPYIDLARHVEHAAGRSQRRLVTERGLPELHAHERRILRRVLAESPPPIVSLGFSTLSDPETAAMVRRQATLFYIERNLAEMHRNLVEETTQSTGRYWTFSRTPPETPDALSGLYAVHRATYEQGSRRIVAAGRHPNRIASEILSILEDPS
ncbi:MAG: shikimate kinase [Myxococcota bacterium]